MRSITYAGEAVRTSDEVASLLVELAAELAKAGRAEAVEIPIVTRGGSGRDTAELVVGLGNDVLSLPFDHDGPEPRFDDAVEMLSAMLDATIAQFGTPLSGILARSEDVAVNGEPTPAQVVPSTDPDAAPVTSLDEFRRAQRGR